MDWKKTVRVSPEREDATLRKCLHTLQQVIAARGWTGSRALRAACESRSPLTCLDLVEWYHQLEPLATAARPVRILGMPMEWSGTAIHHVRRWWETLAAAGTHARLSDSEEVIVLSSEEPSPAVKKGLREILLKPPVSARAVVWFRYHELAFPPLQHMLAGEWSRMPGTNKPSDPKRLPRLLPEDTVSRFLGLRAGDVVRCDYVPGLASWQQ